QRRGGQSYAVANHAHEAMSAAHQIGDDEDLARARIAKDDDKKSLQLRRHARHGQIYHAPKQPFLLPDSITVGMNPRPRGHQPASGRGVNNHVAARAVSARERSGASAGDFNSVFRRLRSDPFRASQPRLEQFLRFRLRLVGRHNGKNVSHFGIPPAEKQPRSHTKRRKDVLFSFAFFSSDSVDVFHRFRESRSSPPGAAPTSSSFGQSSIWGVGNIYWRSPDARRPA